MVVAVVEEKDWRLGFFFFFFFVFLLWIASGGGGGGCGKDQDVSYSYSDIVSAAALGISFRMVIKKFKLPQYFY